MRARIWLIVAALASWGWSTGCGLNANDVFNSEGVGGSGSSGVTGGTGGSTSSGSTGAGLLCVTGAPCLPGNSCCKGGAVLACQGAKFAQATKCEEGETCAPSATACACVPGAKRCFGAQAAICEQRPGALPEWVGHDCPSGCVKGACVGKACSPGELSCGSTEGAVVQCKTILEDMVTDLFPAADCATLGFENGCSPPPPGTPATKLEEMCVNACNVHGAPLSEKLCAHPSAAGLPCAVLVCDGTGTALVPDHVSCSAAGTPCEKDSECTSCSCKNGLCFGPTPQHCGPAKGVCP